MSTRSRWHSTISGRPALRTATCWLARASSTPVGCSCSWKSRSRIPTAGRLRRAPATVRSDRSNRRRHRRPQSFARWMKRPTRLPTPICAPSGARSRPPEMLGEQGGFNFLQAYLEGRFATPFSELTGCRIVALDERQSVVTMTMTARYRVALPILSLRHPRSHRSAGQLRLPRCRLDAPAAGPVVCRPCRLGALFPGRSGRRQTPACRGERHDRTAEASPWPTSRSTTRMASWRRPSRGSRSSSIFEASEDRGERGEAHSRHAALHRHRRVPPSMPGVWVMAAGGLLLSQHHHAVRAEISRCEGIEVDTAGDGFFVRFESPARALECARAAREAVKRLGIEIRAGIHTGECELQGTQADGDGRARRRAHPGTRRPW